MLILKSIYVEIFKHICYCSNCCCRCCWCTATAAAVTVVFVFKIKFYFSVPFSFIRSFFVLFISILLFGLKKIPKFLAVSNDLIGFEFVFGFAMQRAAIFNKTKSNEVIDHLAIFNPKPIFDFLNDSTLKANNNNMLATHKKKQRHKKEAESTAIRRFQEKMENPV